MFGDPVRLYLNKNKSVKTVFGGSLSILMMVIILIFAWLIGKDILLKENPFSFQQTNLYREFIPAHINATNFPFGITLMDMFNKPVYNESYFSLKLMYFNSTYIEGQGMDTTNIEIPLIKCNYSHFPQLTNEDFEEIQLQNCYCPLTQNFSLSGFWTEKSLQYIGISNYV
jgi:hypothetical protein